MTDTPAGLRIALVSMHTSPLDNPGSGDAGGMNVYLEAVSRHLVAEGLEIDLLTRRTAPDQPDSVLLPSGARLRYLAAGPPDTVPKSALRHFVDEFSQNVADLGHYDVVHSHYWLSGVAGLAVAEASGAPHVLNLHTVAAMKNAALAPGDAPEPPLRLNWERDLVRASALIVAATAAEADSIHRDYGAADDRIAVIPPGVDREIFRPDGAAPNWSSELPGLADGARRAIEHGGYLMMGARTQPLKGHDLAVRALAALPADRLLVLVGDVSPGQDAFRAELDRLIGQLGLADRVVFLPAQPRKRLADLLRGAALLLGPSHSETFGLITLEAAACGTPTIASKVNGLAEAVGDGVSGVLVPSFDPQVWAAVISELLADPQRLAALSASAQHYASRFDWAAVAGRLAGHYRRLAASRGER
ncbi:glycosyltransferase [Nakamurella lactea]|uniref:glycosyltransferase n=1 Tax=Nakamurella lactea TaxID=459515 RepID=UPI00049116AB|nr:glycosyltransferase [Nakamurella lactea]